MQTQKDPQKEADRRRMQNEMLLLDSDFKKKERQKGDIAMEKKRLKQKLDQLQVELDEKDRQLKKITQEQFLISNDMNSLKRKMNAI
jgi:hypothetical protein